MTLNSMDSAIRNKFISMAMVRGWCEQNKMAVSELRRSSLCYVLTPVLILLVIVVGLGGMILFAYLSPSDHSQSGPILPVAVPTAIVCVFLFFAAMFCSWEKLNWQSFMADVRNLQEFDFGSDFEYEVEILERTNQKLGSMARLRDDAERRMDNYGLSKDDRCEAAANRTEMKKKMSRLREAAGKFVSLDEGAKQA